MNDSDKTASLADRILKLETYVKVAIAVAAIFGVAGGFGAYLLGRINNRITDAETRVTSITSTVDQKIADSQKVLEKSRTEQERIIAEYSAGETTKLKQQLNDHASQLSKMVGTDRWQRSREEVAVKRATSKTVDFESPQHGTVVSVAPGPNWTFTAEHSGTYVIHVSIGVHGTEGDIVGLTLNKNNDHPIYLVQTVFSVSNRWITLNGTKALQLVEGDRFSIQVFADTGNKSEDSYYGGAGLTWTTITYLGR